MRCPCAVRPARLAGWVRHHGAVAVQTRITLTDDLDGADGARTYRFAWQDTVYEIDLTDAHRDELLRALQPYTTAARKASTRPNRKGPASSAV